MKPLVITQAAQDDLRGIARHTRQTWGDTQASLYLGQLQDALSRLRHHPTLGRLRDDLLPDVRSLTAARHVVFYRDTLESLLILRILHHRMDPQTHIDDPSRP